MKANELMIGDWFQTTYPTGKVEFRKVEGVMQNHIICNNGVTNAIVPIPLTAEILEKNGFSCVVTKGEIAPSIDNFQFDNHWQGEDFSWHQIPMLYVHTLQHALRLCGIDKEIVL